MDENLDHFFNILKCAAKVNLAIGFILQNPADGKFRCFDADENNTLIDRSKMVCSKDDLAKLKECRNKTDVTKLYHREKMNTNWRL